MISDDSDNNDNDDGNDDLNNINDGDDDHDDDCSECMCVPLHNHHCIAIKVPLLGIIGVMIVVMLQAVTDE